jgi:hypothetical protein
MLNSVLNQPLKFTQAKSPMLEKSPKNINLNPENISFEGNDQKFRITNVPQEFNPTVGAFLGSLETAFQESVTKTYYSKGEYELKDTFLAGYPIQIPVSTIRGAALSQKTDDNGGYKMELSYMRENKGEPDVKFDISLKREGKDLVLEYECNDDNPELINTLTQKLNQAIERKTF